MNPYELRCSWCGDRLDDFGCFDNADRPLCSADLIHCPECAAGIREQGGRA
jgi:hypothetical protein